MKYVAGLCGFSSDLPGRCSRLRKALGMTDCQMDGWTILGKCSAFVVTRRELADALRIGPLHALELDVLLWRG